MRRRPGVEGELARGLEAIVLRYDRAWLHSDPLSIPRRYDDPGDREVAAVVAALLAYGRVASILQSVEHVLARLGPRPATTLESEDERALSRRLAPTGHRWTRGADLAWLLAGLAGIRRECGSLGVFVLRHADPEAPLKSALSAWHDRAFEGASPADPLRARARSFLLPDPRAGGACKRLLLLARWCVREDDGLDLGLWRGEGLAPRDLLVPLDVHVHGVSLSLGLTTRPRPDWKASEEVTAAFRALDPVDPVRFDFALARPGILGRCRHRHVPEICGPCDLRAACRHGSTSRIRSPCGAPRTKASPFPCP